MRFSQLLSKKRTLLIIFIITLIIGLFIITVISTQPRRTVANFCRLAKDEKNNFKAGAEYNSLANSFKKIDMVAPEAIHPETTNVVRAYEEINNNSSNTASIELSITKSQLKISNYIKNNCPGY